MHERSWCTIVQQKKTASDREHVTEKLQQRLPKFNQFSQNGVFWYGQIARTLF
jgi:hypothetical protein